jgi:hypothetical protein
VAKTPFQNGKNRDPKTGRFLPGNKVAVGHGGGLAKQVQRLRVAMVAAVTVEDLKRVVSALLKKAAKGDVHAARVVLAYTLGKPVEADIYERLAALEALAAELEGSKAWRGRRGQTD